MLWVVLLLGALLGTSTQALAAPPSAPTITEPSADNMVLNPADVHMEAMGFSDADGDTHLCSDWEIWAVSPSEPVWQATCASGAEKVHIHLGDGEFVNSHAGRTELRFDTDYSLRVRFQDGVGEAGPWSQRPFSTSPEGPAGEPGAVPWAIRQPGFEVEIVASGFQLPVNVAPVPEPGDQPDDPYLYVTELYGDIKVVTRDGTVSDYATDLLNFNPTGNFPGSGEKGLTGIVVDPASGDVFASMVYEDSASSEDPKPHYAKVVRFHSNDGGLSAATETTVLDMPGEPEGPSHQISNLTIGPDGKLYVHNGDGFDVATAQDLDSFRGKVLRMNLDGSADNGNPFYNGLDGITARDYVFAYGFRNPFGGAWRAADTTHYEVENGPSVDRLAKVISGRDYMWDGTNSSMLNFALYNWDPSHAPVNVAFIEPETAFGSGFPAQKMDHAFVTESGPTYATGPQEDGKRIVEFIPDERGECVTGPLPLVEYTGVGKATAAGLTAGTDGLYFTDLYKDVDYTSPIDPGANLLRVKYVGTSSPSPQSPDDCPPVPQITDTDPDSPSADPSPRVKGQASGVAHTVEVYAQANCQGPATFDTRADFEGNGIDLAVAQNATTQISARSLDEADNPSACSDSFSYTHDDQPPAAPTITDTDPDSPANDNNPEVKGHAEADSTVSLHQSNGCTGAIVAQGSAAAFNNPGLTATVTDNQTHQFAVTATDQAGNTSSCSAPFAFTEDSILPEFSPSPPPLDDGLPLPPPLDGGTRALSFDLEAKKQELREKLKFFATASADSTLVARGKAVKRKTKELVANLKTKVNVKLKPAKSKQLQKRLDKKGKATVKIIATATDQGGATATGEIKVKLKG